MDLDGARTMAATELVFREATRLHPPVPFSPRLAVRGTEVTGVPLPAGTAVSVCTISVHRDPRWWDDPDRFDPDRFADGRAEHRRHSHCFTPFGGGAHLCIGNHLALLVARSVLARLLAARLVAPVPGRDAVMQAVPIPKPRNGLVLDLRRR